MSQQPAQQPVLRFRNYRPQEATLEAAKAAAPASSSSNDAAAKPVAAIKFEPLREAPSFALEAKIKQEEFAAKSGVGASSGPAAAATPADEDSITIAPRKPNWDLKRDMEPKLKALERQTDRAIAELVRRGIAAKQQEQQQSGGAGEASSSSSSAEAQLSDVAVAAILCAEPEKMAASSWGGAEEIDLE